MEELGDGVGEGGGGEGWVGVVIERREGAMKGERRWVRGRSKRWGRVCVGRERGREGGREDVYMYVCSMCVLHRHNKINVIYMSYSIGLSHRA